MAEAASRDDAELAEALRDLLKAGLELGVAQANRRLSLLSPPGSEQRQRLETDSRIVFQFLDAVKEDTADAFQIVKEVWSRGETKERRTAARALGRALGKIAPHKALGLSRELAVMARTPKEADVVGEEAIAPILDANPPFFDRVKQFLQDNEVWVRRAAIAGLVAYVSRRRKLAGMALEVILLVAENHEKEIRQAVRWAVKEISLVDWKATGKALADWAKQDPTGGRIKLAKHYATSAAASARREVEKFVITNLSKIAERPATAAAP